MGTKKRNKTGSSKRIAAKHAKKPKVEDAVDRVSVKPTPSPQTPKLTKVEDDFDLPHLGSIYCHQEIR